MTTTVEQWRPLVQQELLDQGSGVPEGLALAIIETESSGNPKAYRGEAAISDGSIGLMQILYATARGEGYTGAAGDRATLSGLFDPATNLRYGIKFLTSLWNQLGTAADVASAYNGGVRPALGFGAPVTKATTVCLERDATGKCVRTFTAQPGQYGNQPYVDKVLGLTEHYSGAQPLPPVVVDGSGGSASLGVLVALAAGGAALWWAAHR